MSQIVLTVRPNTSMLPSGVPLELRCDGSEEVPACRVKIISCPNGWQKHKLLEILRHVETEYIDIPSHQKELFPFIRATYPGLKIIASFHGGENHSFEALFGDLHALTPDVIKIAIHSSSSLTGLRMLDFLRSHSSFPLIAFCIGQEVQFTRILGPLFGAAWTYAHPDESPQEAPGQPSLSLLRDTYFFDKLSRKTAPFALIGTPLEKSPSHYTHNAIFRRFGYDAVYVKIPLTRDQFDSSLVLFERLGFHGLSITRPLKHALSGEKPYNTIFFPYCTDTDGPATCEAIEARTSLARKKMIIFGRGGVAHAIRNAAQKRGAQVTLLGRSDMPRGNYDIAINATPVEPPGMMPKTLALDMRLACSTPFLEMGAARGLKTISGMEVWKRQAARQIALWLGPYTTLSLPPSKSQTLRAILFAALAEGTSVIDNALAGPDTESMIAAARAFGATIPRQAGRLVIRGIGKARRMQKRCIDAGNSGIVLRFSTAIIALFSDRVQIIGDASMAARRSCAGLLSALSALGACVESRDGHVPLAIQGPIKAGHTSLSGEDSQPVSALLIAAGLLAEESVIEVHNAGEKPWVALTIEWLEKMRVSVENHNFSRYRVRGVSSFTPFSYRVPGDLSALSYLVAAALVRKCSIRITDCDLQDAQPDKQFLDFIRTMGADFGYNSEKKQLFIRGPQQLRGGTFDLNGAIDMVTIMALLGTFAEGQTRITGAAICRDKESDRIDAMYRELLRMGAHITKTEDGLLISKSTLKAAPVSAHGDHRVAMALAIAAFGSGFELDIDDRSCVRKSFPGFFDCLRRLV